MRTPFLLLALSVLLLAGPGRAQQQPGVLGALTDLLAGRGPEQAVLEAVSERPRDDPPGTSPAEPGSGEFRLTASNRLDFHARNLEVAEAFAQLRLLVRRNIVVAPGVTARFTGDLYDLSVEEIVDAVCRSTSLSARTEGSFVYVEPQAPASRLFRLRYVRAEDVVDLVQPLLSPRGSASATLRPEVGIVSTQERAGGDDYAFSDMLVVFDLPANLEAVAELVAALDVRPQQVLIEATILSADITDDFTAGVDFTVLAGVDFEDVGATSSNGTSVDIAGFSPAQLAGGAGAADTNFLDVLPTGGLNIGYVRNGVAGFVKALQSLTRTTILASPRVVTLNKQRGEVLLGRRDGYLTSIVTQTSTTQKVEFLETGTRLIFRPFIGDDGYVRLEIHPEDSDGGVTADGLPFKDTAEVTTNILVRSGQTVVIGGLFRERVQRVDRKVPLLGDLPGIGLLFRSQRELSTREEIIVLLTPTVLASDDTLALERGGPGELVDGRQLAGVYLHTARALHERGEHGAALVLLEAGAALDPDRVEGLSLRRAVEQRMLPAGREGEIDARILHEVLADPFGVGGGGAR